MKRWIQARYQEAPRRELRKVDTAFLIVWGDVIACVIGGLTIWWKWGALQSALPPIGWMAGALGAVFVVARISMLSSLSFDGLAGIRDNLAVRRMDRTNRFLDGATLEDTVRPKKVAAWMEAQDRQLQRKIERELAIGTKRKNWYWASVIVGIVGYWLIVTVTGGPFYSFFGPAAIASMLLGQVRATSIRNLDILLGASVLSVLLSLGAATMLEGSFKAELFFPGEAYLPIAVVVVIVTSYINSETLFGKRDSSDVKIIRALCGSESCYEDVTESVESLLATPVVGDEGVTTYEPQMFGKSLANDAILLVDYMQGDQPKTAQFQSGMPLKLLGASDADGAGHG